MRIFGSIVGTHAAGLVPGGEPEVTAHGAVGGELVSDNGFGVDAGSARQLAQQAVCSFSVAPMLDEHVEHFPSSSTTRINHMRWPPMFTTISSRCQRPVGAGWLERRFAA
jgi:hypothetical protein